MLRNQIKIHWHFISSLKPVENLSSVQNRKNYKGFLRSGGSKYLLSHDSIANESIQIKIYLKSFKTVSKPHRFTPYRTSSTLLLFEYHYLQITIFVVYFYWKYSRNEAEFFFVTLCLENCTFKKSADLSFLKFFYRHIFVKVKFICEWTTIRNPISF